MKWKSEYDCESINYVLDKYNKPIYRGDRVIWASKNKYNNPYLCEGTIIGFTNHPSFREVIVKSYNNRIVKKIGSDLAKYDKL